jgi:hypothetical protein
MKISSFDENKEKSLDDNKQNAKLQLKIENLD